jgi:hypothetical protein
VILTTADHGTAHGTTVPCVVWRSERTHLTHDGDHTLCNRSGHTNVSYRVTEAPDCRVCIARARGPLRTAIHTHLSSEGTTPTTHTHS